MTTPSEFILPYDRYQGQSMAQAYQQDRVYVEWLAHKMVPRTAAGEEIQQMARLALQNGASAASVAVPAPAGHKDIRPRITTQITRSVILHVEDALAIAKVRFFLIAYRRGQGASATVAHYVDVADARVLAADLSQGRLPQSFIDFKGSARGADGKPVSRVLKLDDRGDAQRAPIVLQVTVGPGQLLGQGAIKPAGKPQAEVAILLSRWQARRLGHALHDYLLAWQCASLRLRSNGKSRASSTR